MAALDLLSDIGPAQADANWATHGGPLDKRLRASNPHGLGPAVIMAMFRARWGLPLLKSQIRAAKIILAGRNHPNLFFPIRALEVLCFARKLPDAPQFIVPLIKASIKDPMDCLAPPTPARYLFDLSLCRVGRKILLHELVDRHSQLANEPQLPLAAFNRPWPGSPGYNMAVSVATRIADNPKYSPHVRHRAFFMVCFAPGEIFTKYMAHRLATTRKFGWDLEEGISMRKAAPDLLPQLTTLFWHGGTGDKVRILLAVGFGVRKGVSADAFAPLIESALKSKIAKLRWAGINCIANLRAMSASLEGTHFYAPVARLLRNGFFENNVLKGSSLLSSFAVSTNGGWRMPAAGMTPDGKWPDLLSRAGRAWWKEHFSAVWASALKWDAEHPSYPSVTPK